MKEHPLFEIREKRKKGVSAGVYSACSANKYVIEAVLEKARATNTCALIEATANQVNQFGGYTGMRPADFAGFLYGIADSNGIDRDLIVPGGDHLGPLTWQNEASGPAMEKACELIREYVLAGFTKIHIDTSMKLADDDKNTKLSDEIIARRAVQLAGVAESAFEELRKIKADAVPPVYVIGSEVPIPGGAQGGDDEISVTSPHEFEQTYETFKREFHGAGLQDAFERIIGVVVQPGVEYSDSEVSEYDRHAASGLCTSLKKYPDIVFEGHSTDYQTKEALKQMVEDGVAILKVGPALTYALRQALFALNDIENELMDCKFSDRAVLSCFRNVLEEAMLANPQHWEKYYMADNNSDMSIKLKYSYSDRCRYYLPVGEVDKAIDKLVRNIDSLDIPLSVLEQYMPLQYAHVREGRLQPCARSLIKDRISDYIDDYIYAVCP